MGYTASDAIARVKLKAWTSSSSSLTDPELVELLDDSLRSYVVPFLKAVRDEWFVSGSEDVVVSNGAIPMPNSVASTIRTIAWMNNGQPVPLTRVEPENAFALQGQNAGTQPYGYMLKGYEVAILPANVGAVTVRLSFMERPPAMVLEEDAGEIESHASLALTLTDTPLAWQATAPTAVDLISSESPFSVVASDVEVVSLASDVLTLTGISAALVEDGFWVADVGSSPFPNLPIEFHPLLQQDVITTLWQGLGDKRLKGAEEKLAKLESMLRKTLAPRTQGSARPIVNRSAPGMNAFGRWGR